MTAFELLMSSGEYVLHRKLFEPFRLSDPREDLCVDSCRRFLVRVLARAVLDVCMYDKGNPHHDSAEAWLLGDVEAHLSLGEIASMVDLEWMLQQIFDVAKEEGVHRDQIRNMKRLLYNLPDDDSSRQLI